MYSREIIQRWNTEMRLFPIKMRKRRYIIQQNSTHTGIIPRDHVIS